VRVVAATNVNLLVKVEQGKFREDLYYRLSTVPIYVPPLRERGKDVELLFRKFATDFAEKYKVKPIALTDDAKTLLIKYRFPGNIRQLKNMVEQISVLSSDNAMKLRAEILAHYIPKETSLPALYKDQNGVAITFQNVKYCTRSCSICARI
jgi:transcriptional regulator with GAF, ATPase, and Fis domain